MPKNAQTTAQLHSSHTLVKYAQNSPSQASAIREPCELPDVQAGFRKGRGTRDQIAKSAGSWKKQESSRKTSISVLLKMPKPLTVWITINCGKFERDGNTRPPNLPLEKRICRSGSNS